MQYPIQWNEGRQRMRMYLCCKCIYCAHQSGGDTGVVECEARLALCDESCVTGFSPGHIIKLVSVMRSRTHGHLYTQSAEARCSERGLSTVSQPLSATSHWLHWERSLARWWPLPVATWSHKDGGWQPSLDHAASPGTALTCQGSRLWQHKMTECEPPWATSHRDKVCHETLSTTLKCQDRGETE